MLGLIQRFRSGEQLFYLLYAVHPHHILSAALLTQRQLNNPPKIFQEIFLNTAL